jgi:hypothetical protein
MKTAPRAPPTAEAVAAMGNAKPAIRKPKVRAPLTAVASRPVEMAYATPTSTKTVRPVLLTAGHAVAMENAAVNTVKRNRIVPPTVSR